MAVGPGDVLDITSPVYESATGTSVREKQARVCHHDAPPEGFVPSRIRNQIAALARSLPPPRDEAAIALLRAARDFVEGRPSTPPVSHAAAPSAAPAIQGTAPEEQRIPAPLPGVTVWARPGSYNSPIVNVSEVKGPGAGVDQEIDLPGIQLDLVAHDRTWLDWEPHVERWIVGEGSASRRFHDGATNRMFGAGSARLLAGALGAIHPRRYIEIGSGFSSAVVLDVNDETRSDDPILCTFVEPFPDRLYSLLRAEDRDHCTVLEGKVQDVDLAVFDQLEGGDVLFIDSSHVAKSGSDLLRELFEILPRIPSGCYVHFHDIPYPFDYPRSWMIEQNRSWNEVYFLRAFLMYNDAFQIYFWTDYHALFGSGGSGRPTSIWLRRR
jgi:hypothetical protein